MQSSVSFPRTRPDSIRDSGSWRGSFVLNQSGRDRRVSITNRDVALEVHDLVYGPPGAHSSYDKVLANLERLYEPNAVYENPIVTATSREMILDIHNLTRHVADIEVARPRALLSWLFGWGKQRNEPPWFAALKCWSEIGDIVAESEGWDGTRRTIIEHTLHILLLPDWHVPAFSVPKPAAASPSSSTLDIALPQAPSSSSVLHGLSRPLLAVKGLRLPSPFHLQLRIITKLTFNEQGRVSAHRDFWDIRDLAGLIPGGRTARWVLTRIAAHGLAATSWFFNGRRRQEAEPDSIDTPNGLSTDDMIHEFGVSDIRARRGQAPDTDLDALSTP